MAILSILSSFNKISFIAFIITLTVLIYEISLFNKEKKRKFDIPKFQDKLKPNEENIKVLNQEKPKPHVRQSNTILYVLIFLLVVFAVLTLLGFLNFKSSQKTISLDNEPIISTNSVSSKGIKIFNENFQPISDNKIKDFKGKNIIIGIETIEDYDVDRARIRVNKNVWDTNNITINFDKNNRVFYVKYNIKGSDTRLKIEGQLHSINDGWLGD